MNYLKLLLVAILFASTNVTAQTQFYLKPFAGLGTSKITQTTNNPMFPDPNELKKLNNSIMSMTAGINAGIQIKQLRIQTGVQFLTTGRTFDAGLYDYWKQQYKDSFRVTNRIYHILIPISAGHTFNIDSNFSITPMAGVAAGFIINNSSHRESYITNNTSKSTTSPSASGYSSFILWGNLAVNLEYRLNERLSLSLSPTFNRMITNAYKDMPGAIYDVTERHYAITGNLGLMIRL